MHCNVYEHNKNSIAFHEALGFKMYAMVLRKESSQFTTPPYDPSTTQFLDLQPCHYPMVMDALLEIDGSIRPAAFKDEEDRQSELKLFLFDHEKHARVVVVNGEVAGFFSAVTTDQHPFGVSYGMYDYTYVFLNYIYCKPECRRSGLGRIVMRRLEEMATEQHLKYVLSSVYTANQGPLEWHKRNNFVPYVRVFCKKLGEENHKE